MHSPETLAHEISIPWFKGQKIRLFTIWHIDPEKDGTDDSYGWFMRCRHGDTTMKEKIKKSIEFSFDWTFTSSDRLYNTGYFKPNGEPNLSVHGITLNMFYMAAWEFFKHSRKKTNRYMQENLFDILHFGENPVDSLFSDITGQFRIPCGEPWKREEALNNYTSIIYAYLLRKNRPWYKHPRWHIHHWQIQFHPWQNFKRRYWDKCCVCGKRGFKSSAMSDWNGTKRWHQECDSTLNKPQPTAPTHEPK